MEIVDPSLGESLPDLEVQRCIQMDYFLSKIHYFL